MSPVKAETSGCREQPGKLGRDPGSPLDLEAVIDQCGSAQHLVREKALSTLKALVTPDEGVDDSVGGRLAIIEVRSYKMMGSTAWEERLGGLKLARLLLSMKTQSKEYDEKVYEGCILLLEDREVRVRWAVGEVLGDLSRLYGIEVWDRVGSDIMRSIRANYVRDALKLFNNFEKVKDATWVHVNCALCSLCVCVLGIERKFVQNPF